MSCRVDEQTWQIFCACGAEPRQSGGHREYANDGGSNNSPRFQLYEPAGGFIRVLHQHIGNNGKWEQYVPERKQPRCPTQSVAQKTGRTIGTRKVKRLQKREQAAEYIAACESQKGTLRLD